MKEINGVIPAHLMADPVTEKAPKNTMGKDDFMKLLMTQLRHQDPLNPMDHKEFATNLAQFGSLEQLTNIGKGIDNLKTGQSDDSKFGLLAYIGRKVQANGNEVEMVEGQPMLLNYKAKEGVTPIKAAIYDPSGKVVRELNFTSKDDPTKLVWDGKNEEGAALPTARYTFRIVGVDNKGQGQELTSEINGKVTGVDMAGGTPVLLVQTESGQLRLEPSKVRNVQMDTNPAGTSVPMAKPATSVASVKPDMSELIKNAANAGSADPDEAAEIAEAAMAAAQEAAEAASDADGKEISEAQVIKGFPNMVGGLNR